METNNRIAVLITDKYVFRGCIILWIIAGIIWTTISKSEIWIGDAGLYQYYATQCYSHCTMYPDWTQYHTEYIFNPGWVNFLVLWLHLFKDFSNVPYFLLVCNILNLFLLLELSGKIIPSRVGYYIAGYLFMLIPAFMTTSTTLKSENLFITLTLLSMVLSLRKKTFSAIVAGILISLAFWIRPMGIAWLLASLYLFIVVRRSWKYSLSCIAAFCITCTMIAVSTHRNFPDYIYTASTGGVNLIMGANDEASGRYCKEGRTNVLPDLFDYQNVRPVTTGLNGPHYWGFTNKYSYAEVDSIYKSHAFNWILSNPIKWVGMIPYKFAYMFSDTARAEKNKDEILIEETLSVLNVWQTIFVRIVILVSFMGLILPFWRRWENIFILIPIVLSTAMTLIAVVEPRYNFIFLPQIIMFSVISGLYISNRSAMKRFVSRCECLNKYRDEHEV